MRKSMTRARRSAAAVRRGPEILEFLLSDEARKALKGAARRGEPPVTAVSDMLFKRIRAGHGLPAGQAVRGPRHPRHS